MASNIYVVGMSMAENIFDGVLFVKSAVCVIGTLISAVLVIFSSKNGLNGYLGLCGVQCGAADILYYIPLAAVCSVNLWFGVTMKMSVPEAAAYVLSMFFVGFLEELLFRGFLFRSLCRDSVKTAFIVSSLTFGIGHIVNLLNGSPLFETLMQIVYASAIGFLFTAVTYCAKSIIPTVTAHIVINSLSAFACEPSETALFVSTAALSVFCVICGIIIIRRCGTERSE